MNINQLESFKLSDAVKFHDKLNPKLFANNKPRPEVKNQLLLIARDFISELGIKDLAIDDITISGSNAAFTYTPHSDLDLHILVDMSKLPNDEVYKELFSAKKTIYNDTHDIKVHGVPVELYVQDSAEPVISLGEYSLLQNKWLRIPVKRRANLDQTITKQKYNKLYDLIQIALKSKNIKKIEELLKTMRRYRQAGLDKGGEFSPENLAYKALRSQGWLTKLYDLKDKLHSQSLSIEGMYEQLDVKTLTPEQLAKHHGVSVKHILSQLDKGIKVELEHTSDKKVAKEIALDHLKEDPNYYTKLLKANLEEDINKIAYHITPTKNLKRIMSVGLNPKLGKRSKKIAGEQAGIYLFPDKDSAEDALMNWLGDEFDEDEELTLLSVNIDGLKTASGAGYEIIVKDIIDPSRIKSLQTIAEASGYIPSNAEKNDPRYKTALTVDVKPDAIKKNAKAFGFKVSRAGIPPLLRDDK